MFWSNVFFFINVNTVSIYTGNIQKTEGYQRELNPNKKSKTYLDLMYK